MTNPVRTRFAPSPTGYPHVGNIRTALFANADLDRVNLAQRLHDEDQIYFPEIGEESVPSTRMGSLGEGLIDINSASAAELENLPGIGPALAQSIVDYREAHGSFDTVEEIMDVEGIGQGIFADIRELITVR